VFTAFLVRTFSARSPAQAPSVPYGNLVGQISVRHMRHRTAVEPDPFFGLFEVAPDNVGELMRPSTEEKATGTSGQLAVDDHWRTPLLHKRYLANPKRRQQLVRHHA
jgi:hypothetical protein